MKVDVAHVGIVVMQIRCTGRKLILVRQLQSSETEAVGWMMQIGCKLIFGDTANMGVGTSLAADSGDATDAG